MQVYYAGMPPDPQAPGRPLRRHGDELARLPGGRYVALGRVDDTMNLGGLTGLLLPCPILDSRLWRIYDDPGVSLERELTSAA